jgi:hypothetical protein
VRVTSGHGHPFHVKRSRAAACHGRCPRVDRGAPPSGGDPRAAARGPFHVKRSPNPSLAPPRGRGPWSPARSGDRRDVDAHRSDRRRRRLRHDFDTPRSRRTVSRETVLRVSAFRAIAPRGANCRQGPAVGATSPRIDPSAHRTHRRGERAIHAGLGARQALTRNGRTCLGAAPPRDRPRPDVQQQSARRSRTRTQRFTATYDEPSRRGGRGSGAAERFT